MTAAAAAGAVGKRLGIDVGSARIGVAVCDPLGLLATPLTTIRRADDGSDLATLAELAAEHEVVELVVGLPRTLRGDEAAAAASVRAFAAELAAVVPQLPLVFVDERLSTADAHRRMAESGRNSRQRRELVDQAAAVTILQSQLDRIRRGGIAQ